MGTDPEVEETETEDLDGVDPLAEGAVEEDELDEDGPADDDDDDDDELDEVPVTAAGKASALRLLELLVEKKGLALHAKKPGKELIESVARVLESPLPIKVRAGKLSNAIVDSEDVDDLFVDDEILIEILKRW